MSIEPALTPEEWAIIHKALVNYGGYEMPSGWRTHSAPGQYLPDAKVKAVADRIAALLPPREQP